MPVPPFSIVRYGEDTLTLPYIPTGSNGWVKRPEANGYSAHTFGRGEKGREAAEEWMQETTKEFLDRHRWAWPDQLEPFYRKEPNPRGRSYSWRSRGQYTLYWKSPHINDWLGVEVEVTNDKVNIKLPVGEAIAAFYSLKGRQVGSDYERALSLEHQGTFLEGFRVDPIQALKDLATDDGVLMHRLNLVEEHAPAKTPTLLIEQAADITPDTRADSVCDAIDKGETWFSVGGAIALATDPKLAESIIRDGMPYLEKLFSLFVSYGVGVEVERHNTRIHGVKVRVGAETSVHHYHEIHFSAESGVKVTCGFQKDEERWLAHETRQAQRFFEDLEDDDDDKGPQWNEYTIPTRRET